MIDVGEAVNGTTAGNRQPLAAAAMPTPKPSTRCRSWAVAWCVSPKAPTSTRFSCAYGCADAQSEVGCNDDNGMGLRSSVEVDAEVGVTYFLFVDGYDDAAGDYILTVSEGLSLG